MALYAIGDLHLSLGADKSMEVFGGAWQGYVGKIGTALSTLNADDVLILTGDTSWGIDLTQAEPDFRFLDQFPCKKYLVKGNHDYWWGTVGKMKAFLREKGITTLDFLHNNCQFYGDYALCGTRGWFLDEENKAHDAKMLNREVLRLEASLRAAGDREKLCFLHYPPLYQGYECPPILALLMQYRVKLCCYGHLHGDSHKLALEGLFDGVEYRLCAADFVRFCPIRVK